MQSVTGGRLYEFRGHADLERGRPVTQQAIAWHQYTNWGAQERILWIDGRAHPSEWAPHTWAGFSTGKWEGNQLTITTTHLKTGPYGRVGEYASDLCTIA
jgi:hypothetical protein